MSLRFTQSDLCRKFVPHRNAFYFDCSSLCLRLEKRNIRSQKNRNLEWNAFIASCWILKRASHWFPFPTRNIGRDSMNGSPPICWYLPNNCRIEFLLISSAYVVSRRRALNAIVEQPKAQFITWNAICLNCRHTDRPKSQPPILSIPTLCTRTIGITIVKWCVSRRPPWQRDSEMKKKKHDLVRHTHLIDVIVADEQSLPRPYFIIYRSPKRSLVFFFFFSSLFFFESMCLSSIHYSILDWIVNSKREK